MTLKSVYKENRIFLQPYFILLLIAGFILITTTKQGEFILLNPYHSAFLDFVFEGITLTGDGLFTVLFCVVLLFVRKRYLSFMVFVSFALSGITTQVVKDFVSEARPALFLEKTNYPYFIDHVTLHNYHSFPSGHATSAFALASIVALAVKDKKYTLPLLIFAMLVGYSRIYLGQHFLFDVTFGSFIGVIFSVLAWIFFQSFYEDLK